MEKYITVNAAASGEYEEKRSRFIGTVLPCKTEEEASKILSEFRSTHWDARHCVYAYILRSGTVRFSDDGEPHSTAGKPVLEVLQHSGLQDAIIVVVRYFGGVLLGTGGLCRAYTASARAALDAAQIVEMRPSCIYRIDCPYADHDRLLSELSAVDAEVQSSQFLETVHLNVAVAQENATAFEARIRESFSARLTPILEREEYAAFFL